MTKTERENIAAGSASPDDDLEMLLPLAEAEANPQARALLWGRCICHFLSLEDAREGLTFDEIKAMSDEEASKLAERMQAMFELREAPPLLPRKRKRATATHDGVLSTRAYEKLPSREAWPKKVAIKILVACHFRCCVCPEQRRVADIHHIDGDNTNSVEANGVGLCKECHSDAHSTSTMRRNLRGEHLAAFKTKWEQKCERLEGTLTLCGKSIANAYYMNIHRLDSILRELGEPHVFDQVPCRLPERSGGYDTLWAHRKNPLNYQQLLENRAYFESRLKHALSKLHFVDLGLLELGALDPTEHHGGLVTFVCQFIGHDIPDQEELVENDGRIDGPPPTLRREIVDDRMDTVCETCMMLDSRYMYADSSFLQFSEHGIWSGIARLTNYREAVGSNDGHLLRNQLILTPICIGTPSNLRIVPAMKSGQTDPEEQYRELSEMER